MQGGTSGPINRDRPASTAVVVIGAGLSGLAASLSLARKRVPVVLLEASDSAGGCCSTACLDDFTFNNGALYVAVPSLLRSSFRHLGLEFDAEVSLLRMEHPHEMHLDNGTVVRLSDAEHSCVEGPRAKERSAMLRDGLRALQRRWGPVYRTLVDEILPYEPSLSGMLSRLWRFLPRMGGRIDRLIAAHFSDPDLQAALAATLLYTGSSPDRLPATQIVGLLALLEEGFHLPRGGMGSISTALYRALQVPDVSIRSGARVEKIEVDRGQVYGVTLTGGERIAARRVIATCSAFDVVNRLLPQDAVPSRLANRARRAPLSHRAISIQLGCSGAGSGGAFVVSHVPPMQQQGLMHVSRSGTPRWLTYTRPTLVLPELAPRGKEVIEFYAPVSGIHSASEWTREMTDRSVEEHIAAIKSRLPGLAVDTLRVLDPQDFERGRNLYEGALYGIAPGVTPDRFFPHRTPLHGLYLAGQTTFPGYGVPTAILSGIQAAEALAQEV